MRARIIKQHHGANNETLQATPPPSSSPPTTTTVDNATTEISTSKKHYDETKKNKIFWMKRKSDMKKKVGQLEGENEESQPVALEEPTTTDVEPMDDSLNEILNDEIHQSMIEENDQNEEKNATDAADLTVLQDDLVTTDVAGDEMKNESKKDAVKTGSKRRTFYSSRSNKNKKGTDKASADCNVNDFTVPTISKDDIVVPTLVTTSPNSDLIVTSVVDVDKKSFFWRKNRNNKSNPPPPPVGIEPKQERTVERFVASSIVIDSEHELRPEELSAYEKARIEDEDAASLAEEQFQQRFQQAQQQGFEHDNASISSWDDVAYFDPDQRKKEMEFYNKNEVDTKVAKSNRLQAAAAAIAARKQLQQQQQNDKNNKNNKSASSTTEYRYGYPDFVVAPRGDPAILTQKSWESLNRNNEGDDHHHNVEGKNVVDDENHSHEISKNNNNNMVGAILQQQNHQYQQDEEAETEDYERNDLSTTGYTEKTEGTSTVMGDTAVDKEAQDCESQFFSNHNPYFLCCNDIYGWIHEQMQPSSKNVDDEDEQLLNNTEHLDDHERGDETPTLNEKVPSSENKDVPADVNDMEEDKVANPVPMTISTESELINKDSDVGKSPEKKEKDKRKTRKSFLSSFRFKSKRNKEGASTNTTVNGTDLTSSEEVVPAKTETRDASLVEMEGCDDDDDDEEVTIIPPTTPDSTEAPITNNDTIVTPTLKTEPEKSQAKAGKKKMFSKKNNATTITTMAKHKSSKNNDQKINNSLAKDQKVNFGSTLLTRIWSRTQTAASC